MVMVELSTVQEIFIRRLGTTRLCTVAGLQNTTLTAQWSKEIRDSGESLSSTHVITDGTYIYTLCTFVGDYTNAQSGRLLTAWDSSGILFCAHHYETRNWRYYCSGTKGAHRRNYYG